MGSTGSIVFCTQSDIKGGHYKFVLSKSNLPNSDGYWGWTLVKVRGPNQGEDLNVVEYFRPGGEISKFRADSVRVFGRDDIGVIDGGTVIKLYEYDIGPKARAVDLGLSDALTTNLLECALPVRTYDFDSEPMPDKSGLREEGIAERTFSGMRVMFSSDDNLDIPTYQVSETTENADIGTVRIFATGVKRFANHLQLKNYPYRVFYTLNGQAQAMERASFLNKCNLGDLENHLIVQVDCNEMTGMARSTIFKSDRERTSKTRFYRDLVELVRRSLQEDRGLQDYARTIRMRRTKEFIEETEKGRDLWNLLVKDNPELRELLGMGTVVSAEAKGNVGDEKFEGKQFPTFLDLFKPGDGVLHLPVNTYRRIECKTDAANDYLGRDLDTGKFFWRTDSEGLRYKQSLRNGKLRVTVYPPQNAKVGESATVSFGFHDSSRPEPLCVEMEIKYSDAEDKQTSQPGEKRESGRGEQPVLGAPDIRWAHKDEWEEYGFDEESGAAYRAGPDGVTIHVNYDNKYLRLSIQRERDPSTRELVRQMFKLAVGILTLAIHRRFAAKVPDAETTDDYIHHATAAIATHVVTLIQKLGGGSKR